MKQALAPQDAASLPPVWLFVDDAAAFGGHEQMLLRWLRELQLQGRVRPRLLARAGSRLLGQAHPDWCSASAFAPAGGAAGGRLRRAWADAAVLRQALRAERPALTVFASGCASAQAALVLQARLLRRPAWVYVPLVDRFAAMGFRAGRWQDRLMRHAYAGLPSGWITITPEQAAHFQGWARPRGPVLVLPNTVSPAFEAAAPEAPADAPAAPLRLLVLGRLDAQQKGIDLLLDHLQRCAPVERAGLAISLVGEGPYREIAAERLRRDAALRACVRLADWTPTREAMAAHDVLLLPSRYEGVPLVMLEAMALGLPVAAADLPGTRSHLAADCLFAVGDIGRALAIARRLGEPAERARSVQRNREHYERHASGRAFAHATARLTAQLGAAGTPEARCATATPPHRQA